jgi:hypothetical protein
MLFRNGKSDIVNTGLGTFKKIFNLNIPVSKVLPVQSSGLTILVHTSFKIDVAALIWDVMPCFPK